MSRRAGRLRLVVLVCVGALLGPCGVPGVAAAHGPVAPIATSYQARVAQAPAGAEAKVIDGDQRMWVRVEPSETLVVLDYRGAPYLRFSRSGVAVNRNSAMYYLNQTPAEVPPSNLRPTTAPKWSSVSDGHDYSWHDGRLHALATVALAPGASYVGRWSIPVRINGHVGAIAGGLWHASDPSIVWLWPIVVLLACVLAARRVRSAQLDRILARVLAVAALIASAVVAVGRELHGRPGVSVLGAITLAIILALVALGLRRVLFQDAGYFTYFAVAFLALWEGLQLLPTLTHGFVLAAVSPFIARGATVISLGCGIGLLLIGFRLVGPHAPTDEDDQDETGLEHEDPSSWEAYA